MDKVYIIFAKPPPNRADYYIRKMTRGVLIPFSKYFDFILIHVFRVKYLMFAYFNEHNEKKR